MIFFHCQYPCGNIIAYGLVQWYHETIRKFTKTLLYCLLLSVNVHSVIQVRWWTDQLRETSGLPNLSTSFEHNLDGLVQDCSNFSALAMGLLQCCTKPSFCLIAATWYLCYVMIYATLLSAWWLLMAWRLFGANASASNMLTLAGCRI